VKMIRPGSEAWWSGRNESGFSFGKAVTFRHDARVTVNRTGATGTDRIRNAGMKQKWPRSGGWCHLGVIIDVDLPIVSNAHDNRNEVDRLSSTGAAWARP
jgi:hypothetical protein